MSIINFNLFPLILLCTIKIIFTFEHNFAQDRKRFKKTLLMSPIQVTTDAALKFEKNDLLPLKKLFEVIETNNTADFKFYATQHTITSQLKEERANHVPLEEAFNQKRLDIINFCIDTFNLTMYRGVNNRTILHEAITLLELPIILKLLQKGYDPNICDSYNQNALTYCFSKWCQKTTSEKKIH